MKADFVSATERAARAGADMLELHCAHGYLLSPSSPRSPTAARTTTAAATRTARASRWRSSRHPRRLAQDRPISVRLSCNDWADGGNSPEDAAIYARLFKDAGADMIDCSSGQVTKEEKPTFGRLWQTPFADKIRNEVGVPTIAVGAIFEADHANSIIAAGRADLCAVARPMLADPAWTLHEAAKIGLSEVEWPKQYFAGKRQYETNVARAQRAGGQPGR